MNIVYWKSCKCNVVYCYKIRIHNGTQESSWWAEVKVSIMLVGQSEGLEIMLVSQSEDFEVIELLKFNGSHMR